MFAPNGEIFDEETFRDCWTFAGNQGDETFFLDRLIELERLAVRDAAPADFRSIREMIWAST